MPAQLIARKFDGSKHRAYPGRPKISEAVEALVVRMARENRSWGYDRVVGAPANFGCKLSHQTVANILRRNDIAPAPKRADGEVTEFSSAIPEPPRRPQRPLTAEQLKEFQTLQRDLAKIALESLVKNLRMAQFVNAEFARRF